MSSFFDYAERHELALFPCAAGTKRPILPWKSESSGDRKQWVRWVADGHNLAIDCAKSGLIVIDIDCSKVTSAEASAAYHRLCQSWGLPGGPSTMTQSARGGWHVPFKRPAGLAATDMRGSGTLVKISDVRPLADGELDGEVIGFKNRGYCIAPGSQFEGKPYLLMPDPPAPHECPDGAAELLRLPVVEAKANGRTGVSEPTDVAALVAFLDGRGEFDTEPEWFTALGAIKLACGDTEDGLLVARQITRDDASEEALLSRWNRLASDATARPGVKLYTIGSMIKRAETLGRKFHVGKSTNAIFKDLPLIPAADAPSLVPPTAPNLILSSGQFVAGFVAPSFLIDGVIQKHNVYALTAAPGTGKTAIALRLAAHVALGRKLGDRDVERGRVLYFAAENYVDVQARLIAMAEHCGFDVNTIDIYFVPGTAKLSEIADRIALEAQALGDLALVIVDTSAATFEGSDENSNVDGLVHAKRMRSLTELRGKPTVLVLCHPVKSATNDNLLPRGGGSFFGEIDGNLCARKTDSAVEMHWFGKIRGMDFAPIAFRLDTVVARALKDAKGRNMPTVLATPIDEAAKQVLAASERSDQDRVLRATYDRPGESSNEIAKHLGWKMRDGKPYGVRVRRACERMAGDGLILKHRGAWVLSARGEKELNNLDRKIAVPSGTSAVPVLPPFPLRIAH
jgi:hypothetical protein